MMQKHAKHISKMDPKWELKSRTHEKENTWKMAFELGGEKLVDGIKKHTHTCYLGNRSQYNEWGYGCGECPACQLRSNGYNLWKEKQTN